MGMQRHLLLMRAEIVEGIGAMLFAHQINTKRNQAWRGAFVRRNGNCRLINLGQIGIQGGKAALYRQVSSEPQYRHTG